MKTMIAVAVMTLAAVAAYTQGGQKQNQMNAKQDVDSQIESLRADARAGKTEVIGKEMQLTEAEASKFWPIYREYEHELAGINDGRVEALKQYSRQYKTLTDEQARDIVDKSLDLDFKRSDLKRKYFKRIEKETSAVTAARFVQLERRIELVTDLELAKQVPPLPKRPMNQRPSTTPTQNQGE